MTYPLHPLIGVAVILGLLVVVGIAYAIHCRTRCIDGEAHEWQVWVPGKDSAYSGQQMSRTCLKCGWIQRRYVS